MDKPAPFEHPAAEAFARAERAALDASLQQSSPVQQFEQLTVSPQEAATFKLHPRQIVQDLLFADVGVLGADGGVGKTTFVLLLAASIITGRPLFGKRVIEPGPVIYVSAEDPGEMIFARFHAILEGLGFDTAEREKAFAGFAVLDESLQPRKLAGVIDGNVIISGFADALVEAFKPTRPALVVLDPLAAFSASETLLNDSDQASAIAARRIARGLDCCTLLVHHLNQAAAKNDGPSHQHDLRGGTALPNACRMVSILRGVDPAVTGKMMPPPSFGESGQLLRLDFVKTSYSMQPPPLWLCRKGWSYEWAWHEDLTADAASRAAEETILDFLSNELQRDRRHSRATLEAAKESLGLNRSGIRSAINRLLEYGQLRECPLPPEERHGGRKTYLCPQNEQMWLT